MRGSKRFCQRWPNSDVFFVCLFLIEERIQIALNAGHHRSAIFMAFRWLAYDGPTFAGLVTLWFFKGIRASIAKRHYIFVIFQIRGGVRISHVPPLDLRMKAVICYNIYKYPVCDSLVIGRFRIRSFHITLILSTITFRSQQHRHQKHVLRANAKQVKCNVDNQ